MEVGSHTSITSDCTAERRRASAQWRILVNRLQEHHADSPKFSLIRQKFSDPPFLTENSRQHLFEYFSKAINTSSVHGLKEAYSAESRRAKFFWVTVCVLCLAMATYEIIQLIEVYSSSSTATRIIVANDGLMRYPVVVICPIYWVSSKAVSSTLNKNITDYINNFVLQSPHESEAFSSKRVESGENLRRYSRVIAEKYGTLANFTLNISLPTYLFHVSARCGTESHCGTVRKHVTTLGVCYEVDLGISKQMYLDRPTVSLKKAQGGAYRWTRSLKQGGATISFYCSHRSIGITPQAAALVDPWTPAVITLRRYHVKRMGGNCVPRKYNYDGPSFNNTADRYTNASMYEGVLPKELCEFNCVDDLLNKKRDGCSVYDIFTAPNLNDSDFEFKKCPRTVFRDKRKTDIVDQQIERCTNECRPTCAEDFFEISSTMHYRTYAQKAGTESNSDLLHITFQYNSFSYLKYEDMQTMTFDTFISSVGGQTGLWCGASVVSLLQMCSFMFCPCIHYMERNYWNRDRRSFRLRRARNLKKQRRETELKNKLNFKPMNQV